MSRRRRATLLLALLLAACAPWQSPAPITPVSYQAAPDALQRSVGRLRRLVALQLRIVQPRCSGSTDGQGRLVALDDAARDLLARRKGYELIEPDAGHPLAGLGDPQDDGEGAALAAALLAAGDAPLPAAAAAVLARLRDEARVDGVLVLKQELSCLNSSPATRGLLALFSFGASEVVGMDMAAHGEEFLEVVLFEVAGGRRVWRNVYGRVEQMLVKPPPLALGPGAPETAHTWSIRHLLEPLETALPKLLMR